MCLNAGMVITVAVMAAQHIAYMFCLLYKTTAATMVDAYIAV